MSRVTQYILGKINAFLQARWMLTCTCSWQRCMLQRCDQHGECPGYLLQRNWWCRMTSITGERGHQGRQVATWLVSKGRLAGMVVTPEGSARTGGMPEVTPSGDMGGIGICALAGPSAE